MPFFLWQEVESLQLEAECLGIKGLQQVEFAVARSKAKGLYDILQGAMIQPEPLISMVLPLPKRHRWVLTAMVLHPTAQKTEAAVLDTSEWGPSLTCAQPQGGDIPAEMTPLHINVGDTHQVYCCQVGGCPEGPPSSYATICAHVCHTHLDMKLSSPLYPFTFLTPMPSYGMVSGHIYGPNLRDVTFVCT